MRALILIFGTLMICHIAVFAQADTFEIFGAIDGLKNSDELYLIHSLDGKADTVGRCKPVNGNFKFVGRIFDKVEFHWIKLKGYSNYITLFLDNSTVKIKGDVKEWPNFRITGSESHSQFISAESYLVKDSNYLSKSIQYIRDNKASYYSPVLIPYISSWSVEDKSNAINALDIKVQHSFYGKQTAKIIAQIRVRESITIGAFLPSFHSNNADGKRLNIFSFIDKYKLTLIDFWASWCIPCRQENPNLKQLYTRFHDSGFNIISVSLDSKKQDWLSAIKQDGMTWDQVSQLKGREEDVGKLLAINGIPASILVDGDRKIIALDLPGSSIPSAGGSLRGEALNKIVQQILQQTGNEKK